MSKLKKINVSEVEGNQYSVFPAGTIWIDVQNRLRISDGITPSGKELIPIVDLGNFKIDGSVLGTKDNPNTGGWGGYNIALDPGGESNSGIYIPSVANQETGSTLQIFNTHNSGGKVQITTYGGMTVSSARGILGLGLDLEAPGAPNHFHVAFETSNTYIPTADLYFGDDYNYLRLVNTAQGVFIGTNDRSGGSQHEWRFKTDGSFLLPGAIQSSTGTLTLQSNVARPDLAWTISSGDEGDYSVSVLSAPQGDDQDIGELVFSGTNGQGALVYVGNVGTPFDNAMNIIAAGEGISVKIGTDGGTNQWTFGVDGNLTLPTGGNIRSENAINIDVNLSDSTLHRWRFGEDGGLTLPTGATLGYAGMGWTGLTGANNGTPVEVTSYTNNGNISTQVFLNNNGSLSIFTSDEVNENSYTWSFDNTGVLTVPGNIAKTSGNLEITAENYVIIDSTNGGQIDIGANQSGEGSGDSATILIGHAGNTLAIAAGKVRINATTPPTHSTGAVGDVAGLVAFSSGYLYYCIADYGQTGHQIIVATLYNGNTVINSNSLQLTKTADTLQITVGDIISDSDGGATSVVGTISHDDNYTYVGTGAGGGFAYNCVFPLTFTSTDYVSGGNIWKRVAWSGDTW